MAPVTVFQRIAIAPPRAAIYRRLGFRSASTRLSEAQRRETEAAIDAAADLIRLAGASRRLAVVERGPDRIVLDGGAVLASRRLADFLGTSREVLLMGATAGEAIMAAIRADMAEGRATRGVVLDATASEMTDAALDWITAVENRALRREGRTLLTARYSAGYGDLDLEHQTLFHRLLELNRLGVSLTPSRILLPEKSVTAITGLREIAVETPRDAATRNEAI
ncbi:MAG TPA: hypothetical protein PLL15_00155 [Syntrophales bacterium]|jgi:hypothetical protein|nr:hypothetical protein [Syntrophales bacterium]HOS76419.1 hypothetical protein [Syntrophales bacterium]HPB70488.1 hypothetical protein [Syntrophales bacterium]HQN25748.1 hypothetical protein [Syntrophales bacterium]HQP29140.1 hypothetical protein [Syntrophales bacterium]